MPLTQLMYDAVTPSRIPHPHLVRAVLVYVDGKYAWTDADKALFPGAVKVYCAVLPDTNDGSVCDVETGALRPEDAVSWVKMRRTSLTNRLGHPATVYCSASSWISLRQAFVNAKVTEPEYLIAQWDGHPCIPPGAVGKQYLSTPGYDLAVVEEDWLHAHA